MMIKSIMPSWLTVLLFLSFGFVLTQANEGTFDYAIDDADAGLFFTDVKTGVDDLKTLFNNDLVAVDVVDIAWSANSPVGNPNASSIVTFRTSVDETVWATGEYDLAGDGKLLPSSFSVGEIRAGGWGRHTVTVELTFNGDTIVVEQSIQSFTPATSLIPLVFILFFAIMTHSVELSMSIGIFIGSCMVAGQIEAGFRSALDTFILLALADEGHGFVYLFSLFLAGLVGMMEKSGGLRGFTRQMTAIANGPRMGQFVAFVSGCIIFFDDYANTLIVGGAMRPMTDLLSVSREKLAFIVDCTSAPVASITPISSWIGFEVGLLQAEIDTIIKREGTDDIGIATGGLTVFMNSVRFRYYPLFMLMLVPALILTKRDFGPMLVAQRKTQVYGRKDGGDGRGSIVYEGPKANQPEPNTPTRSWNMFIPLILLVFFIIYLLLESGEDPSVKQNLIDKLEGSDSYVALLWGTMAAALVTLIFYHVQFKTDGESVLLPTPSVLSLYVQSIFRRKQQDGGDGDDVVVVLPKPLMSVDESVQSFLHGMGLIFPALIVLTLAWASGSIMGAVGTDRLFSRWIVDSGLEAESLPTLSFVISLFMALATGTSWGTMAIMFPLILVPTYDASGGDSRIFYATVAGVLSGSVAGDHVSPISDTTVLSSLATDCNLIAHVGTQAPYVLVVVTFSILVGTLPVGYGMPNIIAYLLGIMLIGAFVYFLCRPVVSPTGNFDPITELIMRVKGDTSLDELKQDTAKAYQDGQDNEPLFSLFANKSLPQDTKVMEEEEEPKKQVDEEESSAEEHAA